MTRFVRTTVVVLLLLGAAGTWAARGWSAAHALGAADEVGIPARLARIPLRVGEPPFVGTRDTLDPRIVELSGADHYAAVDYARAGGLGVRLHVGVNTESDGWLHEPTVCLPSHGWTTADAVRVPIWAGLAGVEPGAQIWRMRLEKSGKKLLVYYWVQWGDRIVRTRSERAWHRFRGLLAGEKDRPLQIVILYTPLEQSEDQSAARVESLVRALWPELSTVLSTGG